MWKKKKTKSINFKISYTPTCLTIQTNNLYQMKQSILNWCMMVRTRRSGIVILYLSICLESYTIKCNTHMPSRSNRYILSSRKNLLYSSTSHHRQKKRKFKRERERKFQEKISGSWWNINYTRLQLRRQSSSVGRAVLFFQTTAWRRDRVN